MKYKLMIFKAAMTTFNVCLYLEEQMTILVCSIVIVVFV